MALSIADLVGSTDVILRREAVARGVDDNALHRLVTAGVLVRIRQGAYAVREIWEHADDLAKHRMLTAAVLRLYPEDVVLSHVSAAVAHGASAWGMDLRAVHLTELKRSARRGASVVHHGSPPCVDDLTRLGTTWVTSPARTILDVARLVRLEPCLVLANELMRGRGVTRDDLVRTAQQMTRWPTTLSHHLVLHLADARYASVGEVRTAVLFWRQGLPPPVPQFDVRRADGSLAGTVDFAWPELGVIVEFDGLEKYQRFRREGESVADAVIREKLREDEIRELTGWIVIRLTWDDLRHPERTAARIRAAIRTKRIASA